MSENSRASRADRGCSDMPLRGGRAARLSAIGLHSDTAKWFVTTHNGRAAISDGDVVLVVAVTRGHDLDVICRRLNQTRPGGPCSASSSGT